MIRRPDRGFTLLELVVALAIVGALLVIMFAGLRVGLGAARRGEASAAALGQARGVADLLERTVAGTFPYRGGRATGEAPRLVFEGGPDRLTLVTASPPASGPSPIAFAAVRVALDDDGLTVRQQPLPNWLDLERQVPLLVDRSVRALRFRFLGEDDWQERWNAADAEALPRAVEIRVGAEPPFVVPLWAVAP